MKAVVIAASSLCALSLACYVLFSNNSLTWPSSGAGPNVVRMDSLSVWQIGSSQKQHNKVMLMLHEAEAEIANDSSIQPRPRSGLRLQAQCQVGHNLAGVLAAAAAFKTTAAQKRGLGSQFNQPEQAQQLAKLLRRNLADKWAAALQSFVQPSSVSARSIHDSNSQCRSIGLVPQQHGCTNRTTALLLVIDSWGRLHHQLGIYSINLLTMWFYASMFNYGIEIYAHGAPLPPGVPVYFIKPAGIQHLFHNLGYQHVLYLDWDIMLSVHSAPPLSLFYNQYPQASLLLQAEYNFCAGANLWRSSPQADMLLRTWWNLGHAGCCPTAQHDQSALKHIVAAYIANFTGHPSLYGSRHQSHFKLPAQSADAAGAAGKPTVYSTESPPTTVDKWIRLRPMLQDGGSAIGFVGLDAHYLSVPNQRHRSVVLHSCMGNWWGCVPPDTPALLYHTGHGAMEHLEPKWVAQKLLTFLTDWTAAFEIPVNVTNSLHAL